MAIIMGDEFSSENLYSESIIPNTNNEEIFEAGGDYVLCKAKGDAYASPDTKPEKRNNANKKSTASSKERRKRYTTALERAVHSLKTASTSLSSQLSILKEDTNGLSSRNRELKLRMQSMENEVHLQDARNEALKKDIQELRAMVRQSIQNGAQSMSSPWVFDDTQQFKSQNLQLDQFQQQKKELEASETATTFFSPSHTDNSANISPSKVTLTVSYSDYRLF